MLFKCLECGTRYFFPKSRDKCHVAHVAAREKARKHSLAELLEREARSSFSSKLRLPQPNILDLPPGSYADPNLSGHTTPSQRSANGVSGSNFFLDIEAIPHVEREVRHCSYDTSDRSSGDFGVSVCDSDD